MTKSTHRILRAFSACLLMVAGMLLIACARLDVTVTNKAPSDTTTSAPQETTSIARVGPTARADDDAPLPLDEYIRQNYTKREEMVPMRDGVRLFTAIYTPNDSSQPAPILMIRSPYSSGPYGEDNYRGSLGPEKRFVYDGYIFVYQDVRGKYMSQGEFVNMRPHNDDKVSPTDIDEASDTYDTVEWLLDHVEGHNERVGMWGISYPGFYAAAGMIDAHPALKAVSPQAPIADWWFDDFHHHGAFFLPHYFGFFSSFGQSRPEPTSSRSGRRVSYGTPDGYQFFMDLGPLSNVNDRYYHGQIEFWNQTIEHPNYDQFWQSRNLLPHLNNVATGVMVVGGWYDAEDLYGALQIYREVEANNPDVFNMLVMGPWRHGGWSRGDGESLGNVHFGSNTSELYRREIQYPFFTALLRDDETPDLPEAYVFETGVNQWRTFDAWPPANARSANLYLHEGEHLSFDEPTQADRAFEQYISDPDNPVPFTEEISTGMTRAYMTDDQRFAGRRPDVLAFRTDVLESDVTIAGPIDANLWVSTSGSAADWVVKVIDVLPPDTPDHDDTPPGMRMGGYQQMVRSEVIRGRYRNSYEHPEPFAPYEPTLVRLELQDVLHTFEKGHRIMVQIQSTWFPLVDRNPQKYVDNIFLAEEEDFIETVNRVYCSQRYPTRLTFGVLPTD